MTLYEATGVKNFAILAFCFVLAVLAVPAMAQRDGSDGDNVDQDEVEYLDNALQSDRPVVIRTGDLEGHRMQMELDVKVSRDRDGAPAKITLPVLYRLDTGPQTEFRVQSDFLTYQNPNLGFSDVSVGFKWNFAEGRNSWAVVGFLEIPSGSAGFADPGPEPTIILIHERQLSPQWNLGFNAGLTYNEDSGSLEYYTIFNGAAQIGYNITPQTQLSTALIIKTPDAKFDGITRLSGAISLSHRLNEATNLSLTASRSFSATGDDYEFIFGWSQHL